MSGFNHINIKVPAFIDTYDITEQVPKFWENEKILYVTLVTEGVKCEAILNRLESEGAFLYTGFVVTGPMSIISIFIKDDKVQLTITAVNLV